jgi:hypothetical protein
MAVSLGHNQDGEAEIRVYAFAKQAPVGEIEEFAVRLAPKGGTTSSRSPRPASTWRSTRGPGSRSTAASMTTPSRIAPDPGPAWDPYPML